MGSPVGWLALRFATGNASDISNEVTPHLTLYAYLLLATSVAFGICGNVLGGALDDRDWLLAQIREMALTDSLTGLRNVRDFHQRLTQEIAQARRARSTLSLIMIDLDHFKEVNDRYGHPAGDTVLVQVAQALRTGIRAGDTPYRVGGEEFAVICPLAQVEAAEEVAQRLRKAVSALAIDVGRGTVRLSASFGVSVWVAGKTEGDLYKAADGALYLAKEEGRNRVALARAALSE